MSNQLESKLEEVFVKKAPFTLPENAKGMLVQYLPWLTLIGAVLMLLASWSLYQLLTYAVGVAGYASTYGYTVGGAQLGVIGWLSLAVLVLEAVIMLLAFSPLKARKKQGWNMLYWVALLSVGFSVIYFFADWNLPSLIFSLFGSAVSLFILFQIRGHYVAAKQSTATAKKK